MTEATNHRAPHKQPERATDTKHANPANQRSPQPTTHREQPRHPAPPPAPCDSCAFSHECTRPERCVSFKAYVETGKAIRPPRELPG